MTADNLLSPIVTSHCFFGCGRTVTDRPDAAHDEMEGHYTTVHQRDTEALIEAFRRIRPTRPTTTKDQT